MGIAEKYRAAVAAARRRRDAAKRKACALCERECKKLAADKARELAAERKKPKKTKRRAILPSEVKAAGRRPIPPAYKKAFEEARREIDRWNKAHPGGFRAVISDEPNAWIVQESQAPGGGGTAAFKYRTIYAAGIPESDIKGKRPKSYDS